MMSYKGTFWTEDPKELFRNFQIIPKEGSDIGEQMNAITRLVLIIFLTLLLLGYEYATTFLITSLILIILLYYIQKRRMTINEGFCGTLPPNRSLAGRENTTYGSYQALTLCEEPPEPMVSVNGRPVNELPAYMVKYMPEDENKLTISRPEKFRFCLDATEVKPNEEFRSSNYALSGPAVNPKTKVAPVIIAPSHATDYWMDSHTIPSFINDQSNTDIYRSGYVVTTCAGDVEDKYLVPSEKYEEIDQDDTREEIIKENFNPDDTLVSYRGDYQAYQYPYKSEGNRALGKKLYLNRSTPGDVNTISGYDPLQAQENDIPDNLAVGSCQKSSCYKDYNKRLFTQTIQPGMYAKSEIVEPLNSNIGISFDQQFPPVTCETDDQGNNIYVSHDPRVVRPNPPPKRKEEVVNIDNVYDPRLTGYGTSYRTYLDELTGRPRFYYDDIDSIRRPNYIIRSNIDDAPWADKYGPVMSLQEREISSIYSRPLANDKFMRDTIKQRTDLQERLMRKYDQEIGWQKRLMPLRRDQRN